MIEERTVGDDLLAAWSDGRCTGPVGNLVEDALHIADMERGLGLGGGDGRCGLCKSGGGHQGDEHEFRFHGWYELGLGWLDLSLIRDPPLALVAATKPSWIVPLYNASSMPAALSQAGSLDFAWIQRFSGVCNQRLPAALL
jgi:hypothetical protein